MRYRRSDTVGGTYFFTVNLAERNSDTLVRYIADLREVKHGWVKRPVDWPHSTLHAYIARGMAAPDWGGCAPDDPGG